MGGGVTIRAPVKRLLTDQEAAAYCGVSVNTFKDRIRIRPVKIGNCVRYDVRAIDKWADSQSQMEPRTADDYLGLLDEGGGEGS